MTGKNHLLCFGFGFSAQALCRRLDRDLWDISATSRSAEGLARIRDAEIAALDFTTLRDLPPGLTHVVSSAPPGPDGDPILNRFSAQLAARASHLRWAAYLSTTGVYGDHAGQWVDEETALTPNTERGVRRVAAEAAWMALHHSHGLPLHIFRLAGIYGPGRNALENIRDGSAQRIIKAGQVFSRIHVEDIAGVLLASINRPNPPRVYNVADDEPCPPQEVIAYAAALLGHEPLPDVPFEEAKLSPMAKSFYADSKRVRNTRIKTELGYRLRYPTYREGLQSLM